MQVKAWIISYIQQDITNLTTYLSGCRLIHIAKVPQNNTFSSTYWYKRNLIGLQRKCVVSIFVRHKDCNTNDIFIWMYKVKESMLGFKLNHVSERGDWDVMLELTLVQFDTQLAPESPMFPIKRGSVGSWEHDKLINFPSVFKIPDNDNWNNIHHSKHGYNSIATKYTCRFTACHW